jgi:thiamine-monophosphate kinase
LTTPVSATVADVGERGLIDRIRRRLPAAPASLVVGIGDDAAVATPDRGALLVLTTDALVEGVHFDRRFSLPRDIGYKALAVNVSDVAAMGAAPRLALLSLALPDAIDAADLDALIDGLVESADSRIVLVGGNITRSPGPLMVDVTVTGAVRPRRVLTRGGGRPGDAIFVSGAVGAAAAGLAWLRVHGRTGSELPGDAALAECVLRHRRPEARARVGGLLGRMRAATACMDLSDGLADAVRQVAVASGTGACLDAAAIPVHPGAAAWFAAAGEDPVTASLSGGDDYELLFTVSTKAKGRLRHVRSAGRGLALTKIGELTRDPALIVERDGRQTPLPGGFVHFGG